MSIRAVLPQASASSSVSYSPSKLARAERETPFTSPSSSASISTLLFTASGVRRTFLMRVSFVHSSHTVCQMPVVRV